MNLAVFDLDGTLAKTFAVDGDCFLQAFLDAFNIRNVDDDWAGYEHVTDLGIVQTVFHGRFGRHPSAVEIEHFVDCFLDLLQAQHSAAPQAFGEVAGATALLSSLQDSQWGVAIATGGWERSARFKMHVAGLAVRPFPAAFAEDGPARHAIVTAAISRASAHYATPTFERVVLVGDALWDVRTAQALGLPLVGIGDGAKAALLRQSGTSHVLNDYTDATACLRSLAEAKVPSAS